MPEPHVLADTGPIVAFLLEPEPRHDWAVVQFKSLPAPLITCEAVLTEAFHFSQHGQGAALERLFELLDSGALIVGFSAVEHLTALRALIRKFRSVPMSFADACLVRMCELDPAARVLTFDSDFRIYRRFGRQSLKLIMPE